MKIYSSSEFFWSTKQNRYIIVKQKSSDYDGEILLCKGATATQDQLSQSEANYYNVATQNAQTTFGESQAALSAVQNAWGGILAKGANQMGYSQGQLDTLNAQNIQGVGQQYGNAARALKEQQAATGGGNTYLPSGVQSQQQASLASSAANQASSQGLNILNAGYNYGAELFQNASNAYMGAASAYNPVGMSGAATGAAGAANSEANAVQQANDAWAQNLTGLAAGAMGGAGAALSGSKFMCWVAAELYGGWGDSRTILLRAWIFGPFAETFVGGIFADLYYKFGERIAEHIKTHKVSRWICQNIFDYLLDRAERERDLCLLVA